MVPQDGAGVLPPVLLTSSIPPDGCTRGQLMSHIHDFYSSGFEGPLADLMVVADGRPAIAACILEAFGLGGASADAEKEQGGDGSVQQKDQEASQGSGGAGGVVVKGGVDETGRGVVMRGVLLGGRCVLDGLWRLNAGNGHPALYEVRLRG